MNAFSRFALFVLLFFAAITVTCAQRIDSVLNMYAENYQPEKVYMHFDKPVYAPGETIWFKAYIFAGIAPSDMSKNFYVDMADAEGTIVAHMVYPVVESSSRGQFVIPASFRSNILQVRAYTKWMQNFDTAFLFNKIINVVQKNTQHTPAPKLLPTITFFPEGGDAVEGIKTRIAFKANDQFGRPVHAKGVVVNSKGAVIDSIRPQHDGMGFFYLLPVAGETYTARWIDEQKTAHQDALPAAKQAGVALQISDNGDKKTFLVSRSNNATDNLKALHIVATMQQQVVYMANIKLTEAKAIGGAIPTAQLPEGVLQLTLFDNDWRPQAERIAYVHNTQATFEPEVGFTSLGLNKRGKNVVQISLPDTIAANLSVAVTDADLGIDSTGNILTNLLLTGDIKGSVYKPAYYFDPENDSAAKHLDLVMLTHGWRRFNWDKVVKGTMPDIRYPKDTSYLTFSGKVYGLNSAQLRDAGDLFMIMSLVDSSRKSFSMPIAGDGTFKDPNTIFFDSVKVFYQFLKNRSYDDMSEVRFMNNTLPSPGRITKSKDFLALFDTSGNARERYFADQEARLEELLKQTTLAGVTVTAKAKSPIEKLDEKYASSLFQSNDAYSFDVINDKFANGAMNVFTYLQGKVAGLQISDNSQTASVSWRNGTPSFYLNEMQADVDLLRSTSMADVAYIKVFRPPFTGGFNGANGAIAVYTRKGGDRPTTPGKSLPHKTIIGYSAIKEFYSPDYASFNERNEQHDVRTTLYWNPMVLTTSENHRIRLTFFNNDISSSFRVVVEGMTKDGRLTHVEKLIQ